MCIWRMVTTAISHLCPLSRYTHLRVDALVAVLYQLGYWIIELALIDLMSHHLGCAWTNAKEDIG